MCDPISIGLGLAAAGTVAQYFGNQQAKHASQAAYTAEQGRQKAKTREQEALLDQSYDSARKLNDPNAENAAADKRKAAFVAALNARPSDSGYLPGQDSAPKVVADAASKAQESQNAFSGQQADALARMTGFGDQLLDTNIALGRNAQGIGMIGTDKANSAAALNAELNAAQYKGGFLRGLGGLAQMVGMAALSGGAFGAGGGASVGATSAGSGTAGMMNGLGAMGGPVV